MKGQEKHPWCTPDTRSLVCKNFLLLKASQLIGGFNSLLEHKHMAQQALRMVKESHSGIMATLLKNIVSPVCLQVLLL